MRPAGMNQTRLLVRRGVWRGGAARCWEVMLQGWRERGGGGIGRKYGSWGAGRMDERRDWAGTGPQTSVHEDVRQLPWAALHIVT